MNTLIRNQALLNAALTYAQNSWAVIPLYNPINGVCSCNNPHCPSPGKHPRTQNGFKDASLDPGQIEIWWQKWPDANIGIRTGKESRLLVIDIDRRNEGDRSLNQSGILENCPNFLIATSGDGYHLYFKYPEESSYIPSRSRFHELLGIDIRADGGYIVAPPSQHVSGKYYAWEKDEIPESGSLPLTPKNLLGLFETQGSNSLSKFSYELGKIIPNGKRNTSLISLAGTLRKRGACPEAISAALHIQNESACTPPLHADEVDKIAYSILRYPDGSEGQKTITWDSPPEPLPENVLLNVQSFKSELLPLALREWVADVAERIQCPIDYVASASIVAISAVVGRRIGIHPKKHDPWLVTPNIWGFNVGSPGEKKTPAVQEIFNPIFELNHKALEESKKRAQQAEKKIKNLEYNLKKLSGKDSNHKEKEELIIESQIEELQKSIQFKRYIVKDTTYEKLAEILKDNPQGLLFDYEELSGLFSVFKKKGHESDRAFFLSSWDGSSNHTIDRISRGTTYIPRCCLSIFGNIQPDNLYFFVKNSLYSEENDGFLQRFQLVVFPNSLSSYKYIDRLPNSEAQDKFQQIIRLLNENSPICFGADYNPAKECHSFRFSDDAQTLFIEWYEKNAMASRNRQEFSAFSAYLAKLPKTLSTLALLFHIVDVANGDCQVGPVSKESLSRAIRYVEYLETHARRIYHLSQSFDLDSAKVLLKKIKENQIEKFNARTIQRHNWAHLDTKERVAAACATLEKYGYLKTEKIHPGSQGGRPTEMYHVYPEVFNQVVSAVSSVNFWS